MPACSIITGMTLSVNVPPGTVHVGQPIALTASFQTDGGGVACFQSINWNGTINGGAPFGWASEFPADENTEYTKSYTPNTAGTLILTAQVVYRATDDVGPTIIWPGVVETFEYRVIPAQEVEVPEDEATVGLAADEFETDVDGDALTASVPVDAITVELEPDSFDVGAEEDV